MRHLVARALNFILGYFGLSLVSRRKLVLLYQHDYGSQGYEKYRQLQIFHNKRKIDQVWADAETLSVVADYLRKHLDEVLGGICHGTRRGFEQLELSRQLGCPVIGTEISDTADQFPNTVQWDFHERKEEWRGRFSFVYSNSLDQAFDPRKALATWTEQLRPEGLLFIEHTMAHSAEGASEMDPFGVHPMLLPYLLFEWGRGRYRLADILERHDDRKQRVWIFVIRRTPEDEADTAGPAQRSAATAIQSTHRAPPAGDTPA